MQMLWFDSWESLVKILISAVIGYLLLVFYVRIAGKRATSKMNNFDWIVTVAVGSVLASMAVVKDVTIADGALALALLLGFQYLLTMATSRWKWFRKLVLAPPTVLYAEGEFFRDAMRQQRVSQTEILSAMRESGVESLEEVEVVTLEPDAELSVISNQKNGSTLRTVKPVPGYSPGHEEANH